MFDKESGKTGDVVYLHFDRTVSVGPTTTTLTLTGHDGASVTLSPVLYPFDDKILYVQPQAGASVQPAFPLAITSITGVTDGRGQEPDLTTGDTTAEVVSST